MLVYCATAQKTIHLKSLMLDRLHLSRQAQAQYALTVKDGEDAFAQETTVHRLQNMHRLPRNQATQYQGL